MLGSFFIEEYKHGKQIYLIEFFDNWVSFDFLKKYVDFVKCLHGA